MQILYVRPNCQGRGSQYAREVPAAGSNSDGMSRSTSYRTGRNMSRRELNVTLHVVSSIDGFIAKKDNTVSWLENYEDIYEAGVSEEASEAIDCYVVGSRTYEHALQLGWPYGDTPIVVITNRELPSTRKSVEFYAGDLKRLVDVILAPRYGNIWLVGGAMLCQSFLGLELVDEIRLSVAPIFLGDGLRLFDNSGTEKRWNLKDVVAFKNGFVELSYVRSLTEPVQQSSSG